MAFGIRKGMVNGGGIGIVFLVIFSVYSLGFWFGTKLILEDGYTGGNLLVVSATEITPVGRVSKSVAD